MTDVDRADVVASTLLGEDGFDYENTHPCLRDHVWFKDRGVSILSIGVTFSTKLGPDDAAV